MVNYPQNYDLNLYKIFCVVAETKSISKAAELLFVSRQTVSYNIKQLEIELDNKLFFRTFKGVSLTPEAEKLYSYVKHSLNNIMVGETIFKEDLKLSSGHIYIGCFNSFFDIYLINYVKTFHETYPNIKFHFISKHYTSLVQMLKDHEIDMIFWSLIDDNVINNFQKKIFAKMTYCFFCNKNFKFLSDKKNVTLEELANYPLLLFDKGFSKRKNLENSLKEKNIEINPIMEFTHIPPLVKFVKDGIGIGYTVRQLIEDDLKAGNLFEIPVNEIEYVDDIGVIYNDGHLTCAAKKFIEML